MESFPELKLFVHILTNIIYTSSIIVLNDKYVLCKRRTSPHYETRYPLWDSASFSYK